MDLNSPDLSRKTHNFVAPRNSVVISRLTEFAQVGVQALVQENIELFAQCHVSFDLDMNSFVLRIACTKSNPMPERW